MSDPGRPPSLPEPVPTGSDRPAPPRPDTAVLTQPETEVHPVPGPAPPRPVPPAHAPEPARAPAPDPTPDPSAVPVARQPFAAPAPARSDDPQAGIDTRELSRAELRDAARRAERGVPGAVAGAAGTEQADVDLDHVDLVAAEQQEAADLDAAPGDATGPAPGRSTTGPIDPRIRERRVAVTRAEGRRRLRILLTAISVASAIGIAWLVVQSPFLAVRTIRVSGTTQGSAAEVEKAAGVHKGSALLFVDTSTVAHRVEALPWVATAKVERDYPNDLTIEVIERLPVAWVRRPLAPGAPKETLGVVAVVDRLGRVLGDTSVPPAGIPELRGITHIPERGGTMEPARPAGALAQLPDALRTQTQALEMHDGQGVLRLVAPPGAPEILPAARRVRLGSLDEIGPKGAAALAVIDQLAAGGEQVRYVDVRVPGAPATG